MHIQCEFDLWEKIIPKLERAVHVHSCKNSNEMLFTCSDGPFCSIDLMVVQGGQLDVDLFGPVFFNCGRTFIVHYIQRWAVASCFESSDPVNAVTMDASVCGGMARTMIALRS